MQNNVYNEFLFLLGGFSYYPRGRYNTNQQKKVKKYRHNDYLYRKNESENNSDDKEDGEEDNDEDDYEMLSNPQYFINSGCILGRRKEIKSLLSYSYEMGAIIRDDQQIMLRYALLFPSLVSFDVFHDFSMTTFQQISETNKLFLSMSFELFYRKELFYQLPPPSNSSNNTPATTSSSYWSSFPFLLSDQEVGLYQFNESSHDKYKERREIRRKYGKEYTSVGLIHSNNKNSNGLYNYYNGLLRQNFENYFNKPPSLSSVLTEKEQKKRSQNLLKVVWLINDRQFEKALELLQETDSTLKGGENKKTKEEMITYLLAQPSSSPAESSDEFIFTLYQLILFGIRFPQ
jgi:hypothetical protein